MTSPTLLLRFSEDDEGVEYTFNLKDLNNNAFDLTGYTATLAYTTYPTAGTVTTRVLTVVTPATNGQAKWTLVAGDTATSGFYKADIRLTKAGVQETIPVDGFIFEVVDRVE